MKGNKKEFIVCATPNQRTWCAVDRDEYIDSLEGSEGGEVHFIRYFTCDTSEEALDIFHEIYPIKCLDDWEIEVDEMNPTIEEPKRKCKVKVNKIVFFALLLLALVGGNIYQFLEIKSLNQGMQMSLDIFEDLISINNEQVLEIMRLEVVCNEYAGN